MRHGSRLLAFLGAALGLVVVVPAAWADHHLIKITEVYPGTVSGPGGDEGAFVELQMFADDQNHVQGGQVRFYDNAGGGTFEINPLGFSSNAGNGENQRTIVIGMSDVPGGVDFGDLDQMADPGQFGTEEAGAVCYGRQGMLFFVNIDCVAWGGFTNPAPVIPVGAAAPAIPIGQSLTRSIGRGCSTKLDEADDTDNSATDFTLAAPTPRRNTIPPTESECVPETTISKHPKKKTEKRKAKFRFESSEPNSSFECKLDRKPFKSCESPFRKKVKAGKKHKFKVRATARGVTDPRPAKFKWKVLDEV